MCYALSKNGWMTTEVFEDWFKSFAEKTKNSRPLLLLLDGHISHLSIQTRRFAQKENITIIKLPSHTTSKLQPLDISVFGPLKCHWAEQMNNWIASMGIPIRAMSKKQFVNNLSNIWFKGMSAINVKAGFRATGIFPFNPNKYDKSCFDPILVEKYNKWVELGKPDEMDADDIEIPVVQETPEVLNDRWHPLPPLDENGIPVKGRWSWTYDDDNDSFNDSNNSQKPKSFMDIVAAKMNQPASSTPNKRKKRVDMNAAIITHEEISSSISENPAKNKEKVQKNNDDSDIDDADSAILSSDLSNSSDENESEDECDLKQKLLNIKQILSTEYNE